MAEDPIDALLGGVPVNTHVYLENKLRKPLESVRATSSLLSLELPF